MKTMEQLYNENLQFLTDAQTIAKAALLMVDDKTSCCVAVRIVASWETYLAHLRDVLEACRTRVGVEQ